MEAAADLGARRWRAVRDVVLPLALPGVVAGSIFTFSLTLGRLHHPDPGRRRGLDVHRQRRLQQRRHRQQRAVRGRAGDGPGRDHGRSTCSSPSAWAPSRRCRWQDRYGRLLDALRAADLGGPDPALPVHPDRLDPPLRVQQLEHRELAAPRPDAPSGLARRGTTPRCRPRWCSRCRRALAPPALALVLGSCAAFAIHRMTFLRPRRGEPALHPAAGAARHRDRHRAQLLLPFHRHHLLDLDDRHRPHHLLHRRRLQQRARATAPHAGLADRGGDGPRRQRLPDVQGHHPAADRDRRSSPARCSPSRCRSTR